MSSNCETVIRMLLTAIDSHQLDGDDDKLKRAASNARLMLRGEGDAWAHSA